MKIVAIKERSEGGAVSGNNWQETGIFDDTIRIREIVLWANRGNMLPRCGGRLIITVPTTEEKEAINA